MIPSNPKKRRSVIHRRAATTATQVASSAALIDSTPDTTYTEMSQNLRRMSYHPNHFSSSLSSSSSSSSSSSFTTATSFNDPTTADVVLRLFLDPTAPLTDIGEPGSSLDGQSDIHIFLHTHLLCRAKYFSTLLSDRWQHNNAKENSESSNSNGNSKDLMSLKLAVPPTDGAINSRLTALELLYTDDFSSVINSVSMALDILPVALELLFEDCVTYCVKFLEAVPWNEEEEKRVLSLIPFLREEESEELLSRVSPAKDDSCEEMLHGLIMSAIHNHSSTAVVKAFVAKLLRDFSSRELARRVLKRAFETSLNIVKKAMEEYSSPDFRGTHNETEAIQRLNLHTAMTNGRHLVWLVERMIELGVADSAVKEWSEQAAFTADLQRAFRDDAWRNIVPGLPVALLRCTTKLANAVAAGTILAARQVRMKFVKDWLPVLVVCRDYAPPMLSNHKTLYAELEETFLKIISTLPMPDAQDLLQQCLSFSTRNVDDCPHLVTAFNTWFRRASRPPRGQPLLERLNTY